METFIPQILSRMFIECLVHGNVDNKVLLNRICSTFLFITHAGGYNVTGLSLSRKVSSKKGL